MVCFIDAHDCSVGVRLDDTSAVDDFCEAGPFAVTVCEADPVFAVHSAVMRAIQVANLCWLVVVYTHARGNNVGVVNEHTPSAVVIGCDERPGPDGLSQRDTPPAGEQEAEELELQVAPPQDPEIYSQRLEDMRETTDRMAEDRRAREKHRAEMRELAARNSAQQQASQATLVDHYSSAWSTGSYYHTPGRPPWRPGYRPEPEHPIYRPPVHIQPVPSHPLQGNSQLMRPILSR